MTNEEAKNILHSLIESHMYNYVCFSLNELKALDIAIKALERMSDDLK